MNNFGNGVPLILPWGISKFSCKVAKTPKREAFTLFEKEVDLQDVLLENLVGDSLYALERITGLTLIDRGNLNELRILIPKDKHDDGPSLMRKLAKMVVEKKKKVEVLDYLRIKKEWVILQIKESPEYEGRLYFNEYYDCDFYDPFDRMKQEFEAHRQYLLWLDLVIEQLTIEPEIKVDLAAPMARIGDNEPVLEPRLLSFSCTPEQVRKYFMQLADHDYYTAAEVSAFLHSNFKGLSLQEQVPVKVKLPKNEKVKQGWIKRMMYDFWYNVASANTQDQYVQTLLDNFDIFSESEFDTVKKSFGREAPKNYPFNTHALKLD